MTEETTAAAPVRVLRRGKRKEVRETLRQGESLLQSPRCLSQFSLRFSFPCLYF